MLILFREKEKSRKSGHYPDGRLLSIILPVVNSTNDNVIFRQSYNC